MNVLGLDLGGTKLAAAELRDGQLSESELVSTELSTSDALVDQVCTLVEGFQGDGLDGVGIGVPSVVEFDTGRVVSSVNVPLRDVPLRPLLRERLGLPVYVDNDASCAALAEAHDDTGAVDVSSLVMVTVGTGVGGGIVIDGRVYRGATGAAGELGHTLIALALANGAGVPPPQGFPQPGSLEALAAGRALDRLARASAREHPRSALGQAAAAGREIAGPDAVEAAQQGDREAIAVVAELGRVLGVGIANVINTFDPEVVAIGGGVSAAGELLLEPVRETARAYVLPGVGTRTEIRIARSGPRAGVYGAALLAGQELDREGARGVGAGAAAGSERA